MGHISPRLLFAILPLALATAALAQSEGLPDMNGAIAVEEAAEPDFSALVELFPDGVPNLLTSGSMASAYRLPASMKPPGPDKKLPTKIEYADGPLKWDVGANITTRKTTTTVVPAIPDPYIAGGAAGGAGEIKGHMRYVGKEWEFYGVQSFGTQQGDGSAPTLHESTTFGSLYKLPAEMAGGRVGASIELKSADERKTRIEYRQPLGRAEGFVAAEQTFLPVQTDHRPPAALRAGVNRKF